MCVLDSDVNIDDDSQSFSTPWKKHHSVTKSSTPYTVSDQAQLGYDLLQCQINPQVMWHIINLLLLNSIFFSFKLMGDFHGKYSVKNKDH